MDTQVRRVAAKAPEPHELRKELRGQSRQLHERLAEVCEEFLLGHLTRQHKRGILARELQYLLDYYKDEGTWAGIE
jgi:hypothetical protein